MMQKLATMTAGLGLALVVSACVPATEPFPGGGDPGAGSVNQCGALDLQYLVGAPAAELDRMRFNKPVRVIYPDTAVTMDFSADRLNFYVDASGRIMRVTCG